MSSITTAKQMIDLRMAQLREAQYQLRAAIGNSFLTCLSCKKKSKVSTITLIQTHWYVAPQGCTGGDYWNAGEKQYNCPKCGHRNRDYNHPEFKEASKHEDAFKCVEKEYAR